MINKDYFSITEVASLLGISRVAVFNKIKKGNLLAIKIGRSYAIPSDQLKDILGQEMTDNHKKIINQAVSKTVKEFGQTLELLGNA